MGLGTVESLQLIGVYDHGAANLERIAIFVNEHCDLADYCIFLGIPDADGSVVPIRDHFLWFGHGHVNPGDWILLYTASGSTTIQPNGMPVSGSVIATRVISIHWGKQHTIFQNRAMTPMLAKIDAIGLIPAPAPAFQGNDDGRRYLL